MARRPAAESQRVVGPGGLSRIWIDRWTDPTDFGLPVYRPVAYTAYYLEYQFGGHNAQGAPTPMAYHIASLIFLTGAAILLWFLLRHLKVPAAWLIAAVFALHPIHVETVAWIDRQPLVLAALFFIGSIFTYLLFIQFYETDRIERAAGKAGVDPAQTWGLCIGSVLMTVLAVLSDPSAVVLPIVILLLLWWKNQIVRRDLLLQGALLLVTGFFWLKNTTLPSTQPRLLGASVLEQAITLGQGFLHVASTLVAPLGLSIIYPQSSAFFALAIFIAVMILLILCWLMQNFVGRGLFTAFAIFALLTLASLNWFDPSLLTNIGDGTAFLAMVPLAALLIPFVARQINGSKSTGENVKMVVGISAAVLIAMGLSSWMRVHVFETPVSMWRDTSQKHSGFVFAETSLAEALRLQATTDYEKSTIEADLNDAVAHAKAALDLDPTNAAAQHTWANVLVGQGDNAQSFPHFEAALKTDPNNGQILAEYGAALLAVGRDRDAIKNLESALANGFLTDTTYRLLGKACLELKDEPEGKHFVERAIKEEQNALELSNQRDSAARVLLAEAQADSGMITDAIQNYGQAMYDPVEQNRPSNWIAIAKLKDRQGEFDREVEVLDGAMNAEKATQAIQQNNGGISKESRAEEELIKKMRAEAVAKAKWAASTRPTTRATTTPATRAS